MQHCCHLRVGKVANKNQESLHSKEYYQEYGIKLEKIKQIGEKSGTKLVWNMSFLGTVPKNLGQMATLRQG